MKSLYDRDILIWAEQQAELLRNLARDKQATDLDWKHVIEEIESVGRRELHAVEELLLVALTGLLLIHGVSRQTRGNDWRSSARAALARAARRASPSMLARLDLQDLWTLARDSAVDKLGPYGGPARAIPAACPFTAAELLNRAPDLDALLARLAPQAEAGAAR